MTSVTLLKVHQLKPNPDNPRLIKDDKFKKLVQSLKDFPEMAEVREVVVNKDYMILGGNMRYKAMLEAGWKDIPVRIVDWPEDKQKEFIIKDNVAGGEWDWDVLANEWDTELLDDWGLDLPKGFGEEEVEEDEAPEVSKDPPLSVLGAVYQLGRHRLMCGDATSVDDVNTLMGEQKADLVFIDPPYNVDYSGLGQNDLGKIKNDAMSDDDFSGFLSEVFTNCSDLMKSGASIYVCHPDSVSNAKIAFEVRFAESFKKSSTIIWAKQSAGMGWQDYRVQHEPILYGWKGTSHSFFAGRDKTTIWDMSRDAQASYTHPTQKPVILPSEAIKNSSKGDDIVVDVFGGSGSTLIACEQLDRTCFMMELDPKYCDVIRKRYWKFVNDGVEDGWEENTPRINT